MLDEAPRAVQCGYRVWLDEEADMSFDRCQTCKYVGYCASSKNQVITECKDYEDMDQAPAFEWDLKDLMKLWPSNNDRVRSE